ncbi:hypothetical protein [Peribacillus frigoritolerans]|uniref:hypothetical protein n=1 Tax=Peribacillus frigoritolerans TaxID=450367 RepID=UPI0025A25F26|nr:hypothetical protein [Peribacillus frigoritolerans]MDM5308107.1 hypothetical protein [Peribacillus frigoritolerans]
MNDFVTYLNSLNNANSSNENALAEAQVTNEFYKDFHIDRNLGSYLVQQLKKKPTCVILTGHAGDGKTSLVYQVLKSFDIFNEKEGLKKYDQKYSSELDRELFYIKDMSELAESEQIKLLEKALSGKQQDISSIVVSNTGPLMATFKHLIKQGRISDITEDNVEMQLLELMDKNEGLEVKIGNYEILLVNMARIDNVVLVPKIIERITSENLWEPCSKCSKSDGCPIYNNYLSVKENKENIVQFITSYYRWLFESDRRLTIRQIIAQLSYAMTGNQNCNSNMDSESIFRYHFSNLFFGFNGLYINEEAMQIRAIKELQKLEIDSKETIFDYDYFVKNDFSHLTTLSHVVISKEWNIKMQKYKLKPAEYMKTEEPYLLRKAVRRMNILFGQNNRESLNQLLDELFSPIFSKYITYHERKWNIKESRNMKATITKALHFILVGTHSEKQNEKIYLPLQRYGTGMQNVQLLLGELEGNDISIIQKYTESVFDSDENHYEIFISFSSKREYKVPLMLLDYFDLISKGAVSTKLNPSLSHGINKMKSQLFLDYKYRDENETIRLLIHTLKGTRLMKLQIDEAEIFVD